METVQHHTDRPAEIEMPLHPPHPRRPQNIGAYADWDHLSTDRRSTEESVLGAQGMNNEQSWPSPVPPVRGRSEIGEAQDCKPHSRKEPADAIAMITTNTGSTEPVNRPVRHERDARAPLIEGDTGGRAEMSGTHPEGYEGIPAQEGKRVSNVTAAMNSPLPGTHNLMEAVIERGNMEKALRRVVRNKGCPGVDNRPFTELHSYFSTHYPQIAAELLDTSYLPCPVLLKPLEKYDGGTRLLGIPTCRDRTIQQAHLQILQPIFDPTFSPSSHGYRPGRNAQGAVLQATRYIQNDFSWVVEVDLSKFFDTVDHDTLMSRVAQRVEDKRILRMLRGFLRAGIMSRSRGEEVIRPSIKGTPQGGPLSPLLSNVMLDGLDIELENRGLLFSRYADDFAIFVKSERAGGRVLNHVTHFLDTRLKLKVNLKKSGVRRPWETKFLGYSWTKDTTPQLKVAIKSVRRFEEKIWGIPREMQRKKDKRPYLEVLAAVLRGWSNYYSLAEGVGLFTDLGNEVREKLLENLTRMEEVHQNSSRASYPAGEEQGPGEEHYMNEDCFPDSSLLLPSSTSSPTGSGILKLSDIKMLRSHLLFHFIPPPRSLGAFAPRPH